MTGDAGQDVPELDAPRADGETPDGGPGCPRPNEERCGGACIDTSIDPDNCGGCGTTCSATDACVSGGCVADCPAGLSECTRTCVDVDSDSAHCGGCGMPCDPGEGCVDGACAPAVPLGPAPARCVGGGPPLTIGEPSGGVCVGTVSARTFTRGLCTCDAIGVPVLGSELRVDAFDSSIGPYAPGGAGGHVAANGPLNMGSRVTITGDLVTQVTYELLPQTDVGGDLVVGGDLTLSGVMTVAGDAFIGGTASGASGSRVEGTLTTPACDDFDRALSATCTPGAVTVAPPCACSASERLPIADIVAYYADPAHQDGDELGLAPDALVRPGGPTRLDLPCGYYFLERIDTASPVTIAVHGRTALFIQGSINAPNPLTFALDAGASLDVFVAGTLVADRLRVGTPAYPRQSRVYVGGVCAAEGTACDSDADCCGASCAGGTCASPGTSSFSVRVRSETDLAGLFYAPNGAFEANSAVEMYGSIFAGDYHSSSSTEIHYDGAAIRTDEDCPPPPPLDGGVPDGGAGCASGLPSCGPTAACPAGAFCVAGCCIELG